MGMKLYKEGGWQYANSSTSYKNHVSRGEPEGMIHYGSCPTKKLPEYALTLRLGLLWCRLRLGRIRGRDGARHITIRGRGTPVPGAPVLRLGPRGAACWPLGRGNEVQTMR